MDGQLDFKAISKFWRVMEKISTFYRILSGDFQNEKINFMFKVQML